MSNSFQFKQFTIVQQNSAMKVGTDGVLLGAWGHSKSKNILDIGTGTGLIALMMAQQNSTALIDAIEIDTAAYKEAKENFNRSIWSDRLTAINQPIQNYNPQKKYDLIICNPPFFVNSTKAPKSNRNIARHTNTLNFSDLITSVKLLLANKGSFALILPVAEANLFIQLADNEKLFLNKKCIVKPNALKPPKRILMKFSFTQNKTTSENLTIETMARHKYTEEYKKLTQYFYLNF